MKVKKSYSSSALRKMLTSRGPFSIKKRRSTKDFQKIRHTTDYEKLVSVLTDPIRRSEVHVQNCYYFIESISINSRTYMTTGFTSKFYSMVIGMRDGNDIVRVLVHCASSKSLSWNSLTMANSDDSCRYSFCCSTILTNTCVSTSLSFSCRKRR